MRCCVTGCKNDSRYSSKSQGITFHIFPVEPALRSAWLQAIGKQSWEPKERSAVCSDHFLCDDLYETKKGLRRKVRPGAVPIILQEPGNYDYGDPASLTACRICLVNGSKLFPMKKYRLDQAYEHLTGVSLCVEDRLPQKLCVECAQRLLNCSRFRTKSLRANSLMMEILKKQDTLTMTNLQIINRENNQLESPLAPKLYDPNHYDLTINEDSGLHESTVKNLKPEVKSEDADNKIFLNEYDDDSIVVDDSLTSDHSFTEIESSEIKNEVSTQDIFDTEDKVLKEPNKVEVEGDYAPSESSTDDELPREVLRSRLQERKKKKQGSEKQKRVRKTKKIESEPKIDRRKKPFFDDLCGTLFQIDDMSAEEQIAEIEKRKESSNYKNGVFKCEECFKGFLDEEAFNSHMSRHTNECGEYRCSICKIHFKHPHARRKHVTAHHTQRFSCKQCAYSTTHRQSARLHERWHKGTMYNCPHCQEQFVKFTTYMGHIRIKHPSDFVCQVCGYSFVSEKGILLHKKLKHRLEDVQIPEDGPYCELCNLRFKDADAIKRHISVSARHGAVDRDKRAPNKPTRNKKQKREGVKEMDEEDRKAYPSQLRRAEGPIACEQCEMQLPNSRAYHSHFRRMHPDKNRTNYPSMKTPCMCEVCGRIFQSQSLLRDHRWIHTGERPFSCESCGKSFRMRQRLVAHRHVHSTQKASFACALCGKQFSNQSNRQRHMSIHTGLKPFKCEMCGKCFTHGSEKRAHITYVHLKKPWPKRSRGKRRTDPRQVQIQPTPVPTGDIGLQPVWPACDQKMQLGHEKPPYYTIKM